MADDRRRVAMVDRRTWRRDLILVAAAVSALMFGAFLLFGDESDEIREAAAIQAESVRVAAAESSLAVKRAAIRNCTDLVQVQRILIKRIKQNIVDQKKLPPSFFPGIPLEEFKRLVRKDVRESRGDIRRLQPVETCEERFEDA